MADSKVKRLNKVLAELNISMDRAVEYLSKQKIEIDARPNAKISPEVYEVLAKGFQTDKSKKEKIEEVNQAKREEKEKIRVQKEKEREERDLKAKEEQLLREKEEEKKAAERKKAEEEERQRLMAKLEKERAEAEVVKAKSEALKGPKTVGKIDVEAKSKPQAKSEEKPAEAPKAESKAEQPAAEAKQDSSADDTVKTQYQKLTGPKTVGKIDLTQFQSKPKAKTEKGKDDNKDKTKRRKRKRIEKVAVDPSKRQNQGGQRQGGPRQGGGPGGQRRGPGGPGQRGPGQRGPGGPGQRGRGRNQGARVEKVEPTEAEISKQIKETLDKLTSKGSKQKGAKYRRDRRVERRAQQQEELERQELESKVLKVTEFVTVQELATMMNVPVTNVISSCMMLGIMVTMNQRLDAETLSVVAEEFGYELDFVSADLEEAIQEEEDKEEDLTLRAPIVTVMGHVDHGKTSLLDYIRKANVIAGESGGITQHIGAYQVEIGTGDKIAFLDTPGHEAFTAMRARGAQVTDIAIIVVAADEDKLMPQTKEAISHAQAAEVPIIFAINKIDKPAADPERVKGFLANENLLVEDWGGKIQSQDISAKTGLGVDELLEKVMLEAEMLDLKANPNKAAVGTVVEASLDKGRGYQATMLVQAGTLNVGDYMLAGRYSGKVRAMFDERGNKVDVAGPSTPVMVLGLDGAPQAGDKFNIFEDEREAKGIAARRTQLQREQSVRTQKHITLDEIGRRIAIGDFQELNIILKGDVDGSVEALTDSLQKLSTDEIHVNIIHKGVGQITESDILLASASDAIVIGFNVRPSVNARRISEQEQIDVRTYSIIYDAINEVKDAMEGMLSPDFKEEIVCNVEVRETFKISKVGTIAGCMVLDGKISRNTSIRVIRDGVVIHTGELGSLKRFKDDVKEVSKGYECGLNIKGFNDIKVEDIIEGYEMVEVKKTLK